ncbi:unnamed protein product [Urochloa humidicola]
MSLLWCAVFAVLRASIRLSLTMGGASTSSGGRNAWEAASLVCRIATVGLSLASAIMTAASTRCLYRSDGSVSVSYSD